MEPTTSDEWDWAFSSRAETRLSQLGSDTQQRIIDKRDDVVTSERREPEDSLDPLQNSPFQKLRVGGYRVGCRLLRDSQTLRVERIRKREGSYKGDD